MADAPTILVIDDDTDTRDLVGRVLTRAGYDVRLAADGWEGLLALQTPADLVLLDMMMPGMDGITFLRSLRASHRGTDVPVVVLTALDRHFVEPLVGRYDVTAILLKGPRLHADLKAVLRSTLDEREPPPGINWSDPVN